MLEALLAFKRAGADGVLTYFSAPRVAGKLKIGLSRVRLSQFCAAAHGLRPARPAQVSLRIA
ncbi:MAG: hypothetical protein MZV49_02700 [Rhodopseudomonas palustris]|nr:hypothetical protein [Rhodopseudomonas palustris]